MLGYSYHPKLLTAGEFNRYVAKQIMKLISLNILAFLILANVHPLYATVGFAEWRIKTPSGNSISHIDPIKEKYGTCLMKIEESSGLIYKDQLVVYVSHLRWWQYFKGYVVGGADDGGYFIFNEVAAKATFFSKREIFSRELNRLNLGQPLRKKMLPRDGWSDVWGSRLTKQTPLELQQQKNQHQEFCVSLSNQMKGKKISELDRDEYEITCLQE